MHYPVVVITEKGDEQSVRDLLALFDVNRAAEARVICGYDAVKERLDRACWDTDYVDGRYYERLRAALDRDDIEEIRAVNKEIAFFDDINAQGEALEGFNPQGRWDFYGFGGRWEHLLNGRIICRLEEFPRIREGETEEQMAGKFPVFYERWQKEISNRTAETAFVDYLKKHAAYALLTPEGRWYEPGADTEWYGRRINKPEEGDWLAIFNRILDSYPQTWYASLMDCHI